VYNPEEVTVDDMLRAINSIGFRAKLIGGEGGGS
jgi:hypothetical protein